jgi:hypothetical protein
MNAPDVFDQAVHDYLALQDYRYYSGLMSPEEEQRETWHRDTLQAEHEGRASLIRYDDPFPNEWHTADERDMWVEGWFLDYADDYSGPSAIFATSEVRRVRADDPIRFASDDEARAFVQRRAAEGAPHALKALRIVAGDFPSPIPAAAYDAVHPPATTCDECGVESVGSVCEPCIVMGQAF